MMIKEPLPCPFCGSKAVIINDYDSNGEQIKSIECQGCNAMFLGNDFNGDAVVKKWNQRVGGLT